MNYDEMKKATDHIEYVDLGLSVKWGNCNLGGEVPEDTGHRFTFDEKAEVDFVKLPTKEQCEELINNCTWKWRGGKHQGCYVTGKNGLYSFLLSVRWIIKERCMQKVKVVHFGHHPSKEMMVNIDIIYHSYTNSSSLVLNGN